MAQRLHTLIATEATEALLNRNPAGFTNEDFLTTLFSDHAQETARAEYKRDEEDIKKRDVKRQLDQAKRARR